MIKAQTLGFVGALPSAIVEVFGSRDVGPRIKGLGVEGIDDDVLGRVARALRPMGLRIEGIAVDLCASGARLLPGSADLAIAAVVAGVQAQAIGALMPGRLAECVLLGEFGEGGELIRVPGILPLLLGMSGDLTAIVPRANADEARWAGARSNILVAETLEEVLDHLAGRRAPLSAPTSSVVQDRRVEDV